MRRCRERQRAKVDPKIEEGVGAGFLERQIEGEDAWCAGVGFLEWGE